ncbi:RNA polymerase sigma factor [Planctomycetaceae bacterium SH139]
MNSAIQSNRQQTASTVQNSEFVALYDEYARWLMLLLNNWSVPVHIAEDISQAVWLKVYRSLASFDGASPRGWLASIARNELASLHRTKKSQLLRQAVSTHRDDDTMEIPVPYSAVEVLEIDEQTQQLASCVEDLSDPHRQVVRQILSGIKYDTIAADLASTKNRIYKLFHEAKGRLKNCLEVHGW